MCRRPNLYEASFILTVPPIDMRTSVGLNIAQYLPVLQLWCEEEEDEEEEGVSKFRRQGLAATTHHRLCGLKGEEGFALSCYFLLCKKRVGGEKTIVAAFETLELR